MGDQWVRVTDTCPVIKQWTGGGGRLVGWLMRFHNVSAESSSLQVKGWERRLALCKELSRSQNGAQRRLKKSPAITALAVSRYGPPPHTHTSHYIFIPVKCICKVKFCRYSSAAVGFSLLEVQPFTRFHCPLCRSHATLLAGDAWGRVFIWTGD